MQLSKAGRPSILHGGIEIFEGPDGEVRRIPYVRLHHGKGPTLWITAGIHGDEVTGTRVIHRILSRLRNRSLRGTLWVVPTLNPGGLQLGKRIFPEAGRDLNRCFPGNPTGSPSEHVADAVHSFIVGTRPQCVIDLHADTPLSVPHAILDRPLTPHARRWTRQLEVLSLMFRFPVIYDWPSETYQRLELDASLPGSLLNNSGVPAFTVELGPPGFVDEEVARSGEQGILRILEAFHMLGRLPSRKASDWLWHPSSPHPKSLPRHRPLRRETPLRADRAGFVRFMVKPGDALRVGAPVCELCDIFGQRPRVFRSPTEGIVLSLPALAWCNPGQSLATLAVPDDTA